MLPLMLAAAAPANTASTLPWQRRDQGGETQRAANKSDHKGDQPKRSGPLILKPVHLPDTIKGDAAAKDPKEDKRREVEVHAQVLSADAAWKSLYVSLFALFATLLGSLLLLCQIRQTRRALADTRKAMKIALAANKIARDNAYADRRPWLRIVSVTPKMPMMTPEGRCIVIMDVTVRSFGLLPVQDGSLFFKLFSLYRNTDAQAFLDGEFGDGANALPIGDLAPDEETTITIAMNESRDEVLPPNTGVILMGLLLTYRSPERETVHRLGQCWSLGDRVEMSALQPFDDAKVRAGTVQLVAKRTYTRQMT